MARTTLRNWLKKTLGYTIENQHIHRFELIEVEQDVYLWVCDCGEAELE